MIGCNPFFWLGFGWWWIFPVIMMVLCFFMMRKCMGRMMGGKRPYRAPFENSSNSGGLAPMNRPGGIVERR
jgi:hypothetical protein